MFFPWVLFIQMHMVIDISLDLLIETWIYINNFILKIIVWLLMNGSNELLKLKNMDWSSIETS